MAEQNLPTYYDAIVIGAGLAGIYSLHKLKNELGLNVLGLEKAKGVGGTWYWNRYPGVQADTDSFVYRYSFDKQVSPSWDMYSRYQTGQQIKEYIEYIAERYNLTNLYQFGVTVASATYSEENNIWKVRTTSGACLTCRYLVSAAGVLSEPVIPQINGIANFKGILVHTARWPEKLKLDGLRVGIIGTGSTGAQVLVSTSKIASSVTVFQRSPQYVVPAGQRRLDAKEVVNYVADFSKYWEKWHGTKLACGFDEPVINVNQVGLKEQWRIFENAWNAGGGFGFMFGTFGDLVVDEESNKAACKFISSKIKEIVKDPITASLLTPTEPYAKRPVSADGYYEAFNLPNVNLVSVLNNPITELTTNSVLLEDGTEYEIDVLIFATGFEAVEGAYRQFEVIGRRQQTLLDQWGEKPAAYYGLATPGFPNFFTILGPLGVFSNIAAGIEAEVEFMTDLIRWSEKSPTAIIEASQQALEQWSDHCQKLANFTLFGKVNSWIFGSNINKNPPRNLFYFGGLKEYRSLLKLERIENFPGFTDPKNSIENKLPFLMSISTDKSEDVKSDDVRRSRNLETIDRYMKSRGQERLKRHLLFIPNGISGLWTTESGNPIEIHGRQSMAEHAIWSLKCFPDWRWYNVKIYPGQNPDIFWVECEGEGEINFTGYPKGYYHNNFIFSFEMLDGMIVRAREFMNPAEQMRALGIKVPIINRMGIPQKDKNLV